MGQPAFSARRLGPGLRRPPCARTSWIRRKSLFWKVLRAADGRNKGNGARVGAALPAGAGNRWRWLWSQFQYRRGVPITAGRVPPPLDLPHRAGLTQPPGGRPKLPGQLDPEDVLPPAEDVARGAARTGEPSLVSLDAMTS